MKHALFFSPFAYWMPHFEVDLEIMQSRLDEGWRITLLWCRGDLPRCEPNPRHNLAVCESCMYRAREGAAWLNHKNARTEHFTWLTDAQRGAIDGYLARDWAAASVDELKALEVDASDIGRAAYSSLVSALREPRPDLRQHAGLLRDHLKTALVAHYSIRNHLEAKRPDEFVVFNGRFAALRPALRAARAFGVPTTVHEHANELSRYYEVSNTTVHDIATAAGRIDTMYDESPLPDAEKRAIAERWFADRRASRNTGGHRFVLAQQSDLLPASLTRDTFNIGIFNSSEDEFASLTEWDNPVYADQNDGIRRLLGSFSDDARIRFFLRVHPNLRGLDNSQTRGLADIAATHANVELIPPESPISTYALLDGVDAVVTFGTTVGAEALYAGKPSILMGHSFYERLEGILRPASHDALVDIVRRLAAGERLVSPDSVERSMARFGFAMRNWGRPAKYFRSLDRTHSVLMKDGVETRLLRWPESLPRRVRWKITRARYPVRGA